MKNTLNDDMKKLARRVELILLMIMASTQFAFADATNAGQNFGEWFMDQSWWVALAIVAYMAIKYLAKKAWVPCGIFILIAGMILVIIKNPERLSTIGEAMFNIFTK